MEIGGFVDAGIGAGGNLRQTNDELTKQFLVL
jgi:hypothetical protein